MCIRCHSGWTVLNAQSATHNGNDRARVHALSARRVPTTLAYLAPEEYLTSVSIVA